MKNCRKPYSINQNYPLKQRRIEVRAGTCAGAQGGGGAAALSEFPGPWQLTISVTPVQGSLISSFLQAGKCA